MMSCAIAGRMRLRSFPYTRAVSEKAAIALRLWRSFGVIASTASADNNRALRSSSRHGAWCAEGCSALSAQRRTPNPC